MASEEIPQQRLLYIQMASVEHKKMLFQIKRLPQMRLQMRLHGWDVDISGVLSPDICKKY